MTALAAPVLMALRVLVMSIAYSGGMAIAVDPMRDDAGIQGVFDQDVAAAPVAAGESQRSGGSHHIGIAYEFVESALVDTPGYDLLSVSAGLLPDMASWAGPRSFGRG